MTDFAECWNLTRNRFDKEVEALSDIQLRWKPFEGSLSIGQMALHLAGVEILLATQLSDFALSPEQARIMRAATEGVVNDHDFPYSDREITAEAVSEALMWAKSLVEPLITDPPEPIFEKAVRSAGGPMITGRGALARLGFHPAYHQGQAYLYKSMPTFPKG